MVRLHVLLLPVPGGELSGVEEALVLLLSVPDGELSCLALDKCQRDSRNLFYMFPGTYL